MIHPSQRWQFVQSIEDRGHFEDDLVRHIAIGHQAVRRSFPEKVWSDGVAAEAIRAQAKLAASCCPPCLPRVYVFEEVKGCGTIVMEHIEGKSLVEIIREEAFKTEREWCAFALTLTLELLEMRAAGGRFEEMCADHIVVIDSVDIRITQRWIIGDLDPALKAKSGFLERMSLQKRGGVYTSTSAPKEAAELATLRDILTQMAAGSTKTDYKTLRDIVVNDPEHHDTHIATIDKEIARTICGLDPSVTDVTQFRTLGEFHDAIDAQLRAVQARRIIEPEPETVEAEEHGSGIGYRPGAFYMPPKVTLLPAGADPKASKTLYTGIVKAESGKVSDSRTRTKPLELSAGNVTALAVKAPTALAVPRKPGFFAVYGKTIAIVVVIAFLAGILVIAAPYFMPTKQNTQPLANIKAPFTQNVAVSERIILDASESIDADGDNLTYYWEVMEEGQSAFISNADGSGALENRYQTTRPTIQVQFMRGGEITLRLRVFDGFRYSEPATIPFTVER